MTMRSNSDSIVTPEAIEVTLDVAGLGSRLIAILIDAAIQAGIALLAFLVFVPGFTGLGISSRISGVSFAVVLFLDFWGYFPLIEILTHGSTPGKRAQRIRVMQADGQPARVRAILIRNLLRIVDFLPAYYAVGVTSILVTKRSQRVGDLAAGTVVVRERRVRAPVSRPPLPPGNATPGVDVAGLTEKEYGVIRSFLTRRESIDAAARADLASRLAQTFRSKVPSAGDRADEAFLEDVANAYRERSRPAEQQ